MRMKEITIAAVLLLAAVAAQAVDMVTIGDPGNAADATGLGAVGYTYKIGVHEVTAADFAASGAGSGNEGTGSTAPVKYVSLYESMKYCNWLTSGNVTLGAYVFSDGVYQSTDRASAIATYGTVYALPTQNEWYKAAYYTGNEENLWSLYANGTDLVPGTDEANYGAGERFAPWAVGSGAMEQNGTYDMMGNVAEWMEDPFYLYGPTFPDHVDYGVRGGNYNAGEFYMSSSATYYFTPATESHLIGLRVVAVPEPATGLSLVLGGLLISGYRRIKIRGF